MKIIEITFWISTLIVIFVFILYPIFLYILSLLYKKPIDKNYSFKPRISILIAAYNEESGIEAKLENLLSIHYPEDLIEIIIVSDGSTDKTDSILERYSEQYKRIKSFTQEKNQGKTIAMNRAVKESSSELLIFTDADNMLVENAMEELVSNFNDPNIGCVCGTISFYSDEESGTADTGGFYWKYNNLMRRLESITGSTMGANGALFGVRRNIFRSLEHYLIDDFSTSMNAIFNSYRLIIEPKAVARSKHTTNIEDENRRRIRIANRVCNAIIYFRKELLAMSFLNKFKFMFHKLLRYSALFFMILSLITNIALYNESYIYALLLIFQGIFYSAVLIGYLLNHLGLNPKIFFIPYYFTIMNYHQFRGALRALLGKKQATWNTVNSSRN